ncbi:MAG: hypothetical protein RIT18_1179 [Actinomycetota bacterium]
MARGFKDRLTYKATPIQVSVPASSANLGPGFDALALALDIRDIYVAQILDEEAFDVDVTGEGAEEVKRDGKHLVIKAMMRGFEFMGGKPRGIALRALNQIPHGRGLGSSAAAIVGGLNLARSLVLSGNSLMNDDDLIALATDLEGHPDNVAAAALGGATISWLVFQLDAQFDSPSNNQFVPYFSFQTLNFQPARRARCCLKWFPIEMPR